MRNIIVNFDSLCYKQKYEIYWEESHSLNFLQIQLKESNHSGKKQNVRFETMKANYTEIHWNFT